MVFLLNNQWSYAWRIWTAALLTAAVWWWHSTAEEYHEQKQLYITSFITSIRKLMNYFLGFLVVTCVRLHLKSSLSIYSWVSYPTMTCGLVLIKLVSSSVSPSVVPSLWKRLSRSDFTLEKASSMGLKLGVYGRRKWTSTPIHFNIHFTSAVWCIAQLSSTTTEWGFIPLNGIRWGSKFSCTKS